MNPASNTNVPAGLCPNCGHRNPDGARYCGMCRTLLAPAETQPANGLQPAAGQSSTHVTQGETALDLPMLPPVTPGICVDRRYDLQALLGEGGMGSVFLAWDRLREEQVALKVMSPRLGFDDQARKRFVREVKLASQLHHPGIVAVYDIQEEHFESGVSRLYYVMEFVRGETLRRRLRADVDGQKTGLPWNELGRLFAEICAALDYAHGKQIAHRDLSPENIMIREPEGAAVILDFGIAKALGGSPALTPVTIEGQSIGKLHYMSPEQQRDGASVDTRTDIYSLGIMLYECCTGVLPAGVHPPPIGEARLDAPPELDELFRHATHANPAERMDTASGFARRLCEILGLSAPAEPAAPPTPAGRWSFDIPGTLRDRQSGLIWSAGDSWSQLGMGINHEQAIAWCERYAGAGFTDWRMPSLVELQELRKALLESPPSEPSWMEPGGGEWFWTSDTPGAGLAYGFHWPEGQVREAPISETKPWSVRPVRSG
ncbi:MAG: Serine/threonine-protein kinase PknD [Myxococcota bacterium]|nr:Serine/threonine-protein kinase PknD [Myxococcota bacterium]